MFTGIIESIGTIKSFIKKGQNYTIIIDSKMPLSDVNIGDSIAVNGVCLTVKYLSPNSFTADISQETYNRTSFKNYIIGSFVNLEKALTLKSRLGGHLVSGHIDNTAKIINIKNIGNMKHVFIEIDYSLLKYLVTKGSITIDGMSLTVNNINKNIIEIMLIGHTLTKTIAQFYKIDSKVNIEVDLIAKYLENFVKHKKLDNAKIHGIDKDFLNANGFL